MILRAFVWCVLSLFLLVVEGRVGFQHLHCSEGGLSPKDVFTQLYKHKISIKLKDIALNTKPLGSGAEGIVQKATYRNCTFALKKTHGLVNRIKLYYEIKRTKLLAHPNVVEVLGSVQGSLATTLYDYDLSKVSVKTHSTRQIIHYILNILDGVEHVHNKGYVHGDLKPENILISVKEGKAVVADFGMISVDHKVLFGFTCEYSPLAIPGRWTATRAHDVFSLGQIFKHLFGASITARERRRDIDSKSWHTFSTFQEELNPFLYKAHSPQWKSFIEDGPVDLIEACTQETYCKRPTIAGIRQKIIEFAWSKGYNFKSSLLKQATKPKATKQPFVIRDCTKFPEELEKIQLETTIIDSRTISVIDFDHVHVGEVMGKVVPQRFWHLEYPIYKGNVGGCKVYVQFTQSKPATYSRKEQIRLPLKKGLQYEDLHLVALSHAQVDATIRRTENFLLYQAVSDGYPLSRVTKKLSIFARLWQAFKSFGYKLLHTFGLARVVNS